MADGRFSMGSRPSFHRGLHVVIDEDHLFDSERSHTTEQVGFIAFDARHRAMWRRFSETGTVSGVNNAGWTTVTLDRSYGRWS